MIHVRNSLVSLSVLALMCSGCDSDKNTKAKQHNSDQNPWLQDSDNDHIKTYLSDIEDKMVARCKQGQPFALGQCWDSLFISDKGEISLMKDGVKEVLFAVNPVVVSEKIAAYYTYEDTPYSYNPNLIKVSNFYMDQTRTETSHWFLPGSLDLINPDGEHKVIPNQSILVEGFYQHFTLIETNWFYGNLTDEAKVYNEFNGSMQLNGKTYLLPLTQKNIEEVCNHGESLGVDTSLTCNVGHLFLDFYMVRTPSDRGNDPQWMQRRVAQSVRIGMKQSN